MLQRGLIRVLGDVNNNDWMSLDEGDDELDDLEKRLRAIDLPTKVEIMHTILI
jgi:hypothetical protein